MSNYFRFKENKNFGSIIFPEYPGFSINRGETTEKSFNDLIDNLSKYIQNTIKGKKLIIAGFSFGCHLALKLALKLSDNENLKGIIIVCPLRDIRSTGYNLTTNYTFYIFSWFCHCLLNQDLII